MQVSPRLRALIVGDSYVRHLVHYIIHTTKSQNFALHDVDVSFESVRGGTVQHLETILPTWLDEYQPHILIFQVGANDLSNRNLTAWTVADRLAQLGQQAREQHGVLKVAVGTAFDRKSYPNILPRYPDKIIQFNRWLKAVISQEHHLTYWRHARTVFARNILHQDGVHLNDKGNRKLYKSFRSLLIKLVNTLSRERVPIQQ